MTKPKTVQGNRVQALMADSSFPTGSIVTITGGICNCAAITGSMVQKMIAEHTALKAAHFYNDIEPVIIDYMDALRVPDTLLILDSLSAMATAAESGEYLGEGKIVQSKKGHEKKKFDGIKGKQRINKRENIRRFNR